MLSGAFQCLVERNVLLLDHIGHDNTRTLFGPWKKKCIITKSHCHNSCAVVLSQNEGAGCCIICVFVCLMKQEWLCVHVVYWNHLQEGGKRRECQHWPDVRHPVIYRHRSVVHFSHCSLSHTRFLTLVSSHWFPSVKFYPLESVANPRSEWRLGRVYRETENVPLKKKKKMNTLVLCARIVCDVRSSLWP